MLVEAISTHLFRSSRHIFANPENPASYQKTNRETYSHRNHMGINNTALLDTRLDTRDAKEVAKGKA